MTTTFDEYLTLVDGELARIHVDLERAASSPDPSRPVLVWAAVPLRSPDGNGLYVADEAARLTEFRAVLESRSEMLKAATYVGDLTTEGRREFYFYSCPVDDGELVALASVRHPL